MGMIKKKPNPSKAKAIQLASMKSHFPEFVSYYNKDKNLIFVGNIQPSPMMSEYKVSIEYRESLMPRVRVIEPALVENPPHFHHSIGCLCLYKPDDFNWLETKPISNYIVTWTACWLYFYEVWKETGKWFGPEAEHTEKKEGYD
jgi:hypothetical protein